MPTNRLRLDFSLSTTDERADFLHKYLAEPQFITRPPTSEELETMGNYLLWGKDPETGLNAKQAGIVDIETKHGTWDKDPVESLDGLLEQPTFNEASLMTLDAPPIKTKKEVFSREEALTQCPDYLRPTFEDLFRRIDELDLKINYYDLAHNKRKNPPRDELLNVFTAAEQEELRLAAEKWNQFHYLKMRHQLVEMRREQYTLRDTYRETVNMGGTPDFTLIAADDPEIDAEIEVLPLGTQNKSYASKLLFKDWFDLIPSNYDEAALHVISDYYWSKKKYTPSSTQFYIDFRDLEHVYQIILMFDELDAAGSFVPDGTLPLLMKTFDFYVERADLSPLQRDVLNLKMNKAKNEEIAKEINKKHNKTYNANYISTIFRQMIIPKINEAARYHEKIVENLFFEEEFKRCSMCGRTYLKDVSNFTRQGRSADGLSSRCKKCEKAARAKK